MKVAKQQVHRADCGQHTVQRWIGAHDERSRLRKVEISTAALLEELFHTARHALCPRAFLPRRRVEAPPAGLLPRPVVARLAEPEGDGWRVQVRSPWSSDREASVLVPGMRRPALLPGAYQFENHRGERVDLLHPGMEGVLHCEIDGLGKGLYVRA